MNMLEQLARLVLPKETPDNFDIVKIETDEPDIDSMSLTIHLDERMNAYLQKSKDYESTGFMNAVRIKMLACDAVQEMRIKHRWDVIQEANDNMENAKLEGRKYVPFRYENGDTRKELLARSRYLLFKSGEKWTLSQSKRAEILFREYPDF